MGTIKYPLTNEQMYTVLQHKNSVDVTTEKAAIGYVRARKRLDLAAEALQTAQKHQQKAKELEDQHKAVSIEQINSWMPEQSLSAATMVLHSVPLKQVDQDPSKRSILQYRMFNVVLAGTVSPSNQMYSGRCWMFSGLNIFKRSLILSNALRPDFEFSQSYLFFWHYFEQYNSMMNLFHYSKDIGPAERVDLLSKPLHDGGNWINFKRLVSKYGIIPKSMYRESWPSSHSSEMNQILCHLLQNDIANAPEDDTEFTQYRDARLKTILNILCSCMGKPPMGKFTSTLQNLRNQTIKIESTPIDLFNQLNANYNIEKQVNVIHDPRNKDMEWFTTNRQEQRAIPSLMFNVVDMSLICEMVLKSIQRGQGVWFACNMNEDVSSSLQGMAKGLYRPGDFLPGENHLDMDKVNRMRWGRARCNHAMLIVGVEAEKIPETDKIICKSFNIENSWGAEGPGKGFYKMTADWFHEHVYEVVIHQDILLDMQLDISNQTEPTVLPYYDFFG